MLETNRPLENRQNPLQHATNRAPPGTWECLLPFETLTWSDEVYDLFELPRGFRVSREETLGFYTEESRTKLEFVRSRAIQQGIPFILEAELVTALGKRRWVRISAAVEYENDIPVRIFGTKQDITEEKAGQGRSVTF